MRCDKCSNDFEAGESINLLAVKQSVEGSQSGGGVITHYYSYRVTDSVSVGLCEQCILEEYKTTAKKVLIVIFSSAPILLTILVAYGYSVNDISLLTLIIAIILIWGLIALSIVAINRKFKQPEFKPSEDVIRRMLNSYATKKLGQSNLILLTPEEWDEWQKHPR